LLVAVVGGNLQGVEAAYLARKAGWAVKIIDKNLQAPASGLSDIFEHIDVTAENDLRRALDDVDLVIPALEDDDALTHLIRWSRKKGIPFAFDPDAYAISSSKLKSDELFTRLDLPVPLPWPDCGVPVLAKPSKGSGSKGVKVFHDSNSLTSHLSTALHQDGFVLQEYLVGSLHSLEVIGIPGHYRGVQVTDLYVDENFDCKRVVSPSELPPELVADFEKLSLTIAEALSMRGIMDVEVICQQGSLKVLEIDVRLPSQTPTAVYWSTGQNLIERLGELFAEGFNTSQAGTYNATGTVYEHIRLSPGLLEVKGEHIMAGGGILHLLQDFFGADEAITNFDFKKDQWVATLIVSGTDRRSALAKRDRVIEEIAKRYSIKKVDDSTPVFENMQS
jgi:pyrrolysine biosynthesis protein PylC